MRVAAEAAKKDRELLVHHGVVGDGVDEIVFLVRGRQLAVEQQVADFQEIALLGQLLDRIAAIEQDALVAVDIGDLRFAAAGRGEARIEGEMAEVGVELADVDDSRTDRPVEQRQSIDLPVALSVSVTVLRLVVFLSIAGLLFTAWCGAKP